MAAGGHFEKKNESCIFIWNGQKSKRKWISDIQNGCRRPFWAKRLKLHFDLKLRKIQTKINFRHPHVHPSCFEWYHFRCTIFYRKFVIHISLQCSRARDILYTTVSCFLYFQWGTFRTVITQVWWHSILPKFPIRATCGSGQLLPDYIE